MVEEIQFRHGPETGAGQTGDIQRGADFYHGGSGATSAYEDSKKGLDILGVHRGVLDLKGSFQILSEGNRKFDITMTPTSGIAFMARRISGFCYVNDIVLAILEQLKYD